MSEYNLIILCGKSGAGKDYILKNLFMSNMFNLNPVILDTTRPKRAIETNGIEYYFLSEEKYKIKNHIAETVFNNWYYGIPIDSLQKNMINVAILSPEAINNLYSTVENINIQVFYISSSDKSRLLRQLYREEYPDVSEICRRFLADEEDFKNLNFPFRKLRNSFESDVSQCIAIIEETINEMQY